jgi:hypothetical protein
MKILSALKGISGEFELGRLLLTGSTLAGITTPIGFQIADMCHNGWHFNVGAWCVAYPGGLAALNSLGAFSIGKKDQAVATARATDAASNAANPPPPSAPPPPGH